MRMEVGMMDIDVESSDLAAAAANLVSYPGAPSRNAVEEFLRSYPFPIIFRALSKEAENGDFVRTVVDALEKILLSPLTGILLLQVLPYANLGLSANSPLIRRLSCRCVAKFLEDGGLESAEPAVILEITTPLIGALSDEDTSVAKAAADALLQLSKSPVGLSLLFFSDDQLSKLATRGSALTRIRTLSLTAQIFGMSDSAAAAVQNSGILAALEREVGNANDMLAQMSAVEILGELAETPTGCRLLLAGNFVKQLVSLIRNFDLDPIVRSRSMLMGSRLISTVSEPDALEIIEAISNCLRRCGELERTSEHWDRSEKGAAIEALGRIGSYAYGAEVILRGPAPPAEYVICSAFVGQGDVTHLAALHALAQLAGSEREETILSDEAENALRNMIFDVIHGSVSNKLMQLLRETSEHRQAVYMLLIPLVSRSWCLWEVCSSNELIDFLVDPRTESLKTVMEWRHSCCRALSTGLAVRRGTGVRQEILEKLNEAVSRGPYLSKNSLEAIPTVATQERF